MNILEAHRERSALGLPACSEEFTGRYVTAGTTGIVRELRCPHFIDPLRYEPVELPRHAACSCGQEFGEHLDGTGRCLGVDSYGQPCACPSFELSQECREALERGEQL